MVDISLGCASDYSSRISSHHHWPERPILLTHRPSHCHWPVRALKAMPGFVIYMHFSNQVGERVLHFIEGRHCPRWHHGKSSLELLIAPKVVSSTISTCNIFARQYNLSSYCQLIQPIGEALEQSSLSAKNSNEPSKLLKPFAPKEAISWSQHQNVKVN